MKFIWLLLLMPVHAGEKVTVFPGSFETREACEHVGEVLITQRDFRCRASPQQTSVAALRAELTVAGLEPYRAIRQD